MEENKYPSILATPLGGTQYVVNISQMFGSPYTFDEVIYILGIATPDDVITFKINSDGGDLFSLIALKNAVKMSQAYIRMELLGLGASAGSALFLCDANEYIIGDDSCMMIHNMICGVGYDDTQKIVTRALHNAKINARFVKDAYKDFLSLEEIEAVINNSKEIYLEDFEIRERLQHREEMKSKKLQQDIQDQLDTPADLSEHSTESLEEELKLLELDKKDIQAELRKRKKIDNSNGNKS